MKNARRASPQFTGRHMVLSLVAFFGVVMAVNFTMATLAVGGFGGVIVENTYVASQRFNGWLDKARSEAALGWGAEVGREDGRLVVAASGVPQGATVTATLRRPLGPAEVREMTFEDRGGGRFVSAAPLEGGRWIVRLAIVSGGQSWHAERRIG